MESFLRDCDCEEYATKFKENDINIENLIELTPDLLKELIPSIGKRIKFSKKLNSSLQEANDTTATTESIPSTSSFSWGEANDTTPITQSIPITSFSVDENNDETSSVTEIDTSQNSIEIENYILTPSFPDFDLNTLLSTTPLGLSVLNFYKTYNKLDATRRNRLTDIIIKHIFNYIVKNRLKHEQYNILTSKIVSLFPTECSSTFYVPAIRKINSYTGRSLLARGKLVDKCRNLMHKCFGELRDKSNKRISEVENSEIVKRRKLTDQLKDDILWLRIRNDPWDDVVQKWQNTFEIRLNSQAQTIENFINDWPILKDSRAVGLISLDFERLYKDCTLNLLLNWDTFFGKLLEHRKLHITDKYAIDLLDLLEHETLSDDSKFTIQLILLSYLVPPRGRITIDRKHWKFSTIECCESIICHAKIPGDICGIIEQQKTKAGLRKQSVQPYLVIVGPTLQNIENAYVIIDELRYMCQSVKSAFDICFQIFHVLNAKYPPSGEHIYYLIQKGVYKITCKSDKVIPFIMDILQDVAISSVE